MTKHTVDLLWEQVEELIAQELLWDYEYFNEYFETGNRPSSGVFDNDEKEDIKKIKKMRKALKLVLSYYGKKV